METVSTHKRFVALDVLRGLTVAFMCIVNNRASSQVFAPLRHSSWNGCTPTDLVYPFFVFCMGVAMAFSLSRYSSLGGGAGRKVLKRSCLIFLVGFLLNIFPFYPVSPHDETVSFGSNYLWWIQHWRIFGVLQRIAMSYLIAGLVILGLRKDALKVGLAAVGLAAVHTAVLLIFGDLTLEGNISGKIDIALVGPDHVYHGYGIPFDPEGVLGSLTGACTAILGYLAGRLVKGRESMEYKVASLFFFGCCALAAGKILDIWLPINKPLWSASYVLYAGGWAMLSLAFISYLTEIKGFVRLFTPAVAMGMNALMAFVLSGVIAKMFRVVHWSPGRLYFSANEYTSLCYSLLFMLVIFAFQWFFYKKKIVIKL